MPANCQKKKKESLEVFLCQYQEIKNHLFSARQKVLDCLLVFILKNIRRLQKKQVSDSQV